MRFFHGVAYLSKAPKKGLTRKIPLHIEIVKYKLFLTFNAPK
jgi:hypothetical protein